MRLSELLIILLLVASASAASAAEEVPPALSNLQYLRDEAETRGFSLGRPSKAVPTPDGQLVLFLRSQPRSPKLELYEFSVGTGQARLLVSPEDILKGAQEKLSAEERSLRERMRVSLAGFTDFQLSKSGNQVLLGLSGKLYVIDRQSRAVQQLNTSPGTIVDAKFSPEGMDVGYVLDHDLYLFNLATSKEHRITSGGSEELSHGLAEFVAREEMGRFSGYWWSPDSRSVAYQETDVKGVEVWSVADPAKPNEPPYAARYPRPGKRNANVRLGIKAVAGGDTTWVEWDREHYPYLTTVRWDETGPLCLAVQTRDQTEILLLRADPKTGRTTRLLAEHDAAWVSVRQDVPQWLDNDRGFLWASERTGRWDLEWRDPDGTFRQSLTRPESGFGELVDLNPATGDIIFLGRPDPTQQQVVRTSLKNPSPKALTSSLGWHGASCNRTHSTLVVTSSDLEELSRASVWGVGGERLGQLPSVAETPPFVPKVELIRIGEAPGFYAGIVRPREFSPNNKYPVIVHVYGGPLPPDSSGMVVASMGSWLIPQWIADQGFIVVSMDGRGTPGRGHDWERAISRRFDSVPLADQVSALKALAAKYPELDLDRVGIFGWSFGGYMAALAVMKQPDLFKVGVAGAPPTDWEDYDTHYTERYLGFPETDRRAYHDGSLLTWAPGLRRPLLLVHGTGDDNVYFRHTLKLVDTLFRSGKTFELLPLSGLTHMVPDPVVNEQLYSRIVLHFKRSLPPRTP